MTNIRTAARPYRLGLMYLLAALAGVATGLAIWWPARATARWIPADARAVTVTPVSGGNPVSSFHPDTSWQRRYLSREKLDQPARLAEVMYYWTSSSRISFPFSSRYRACIRSPFRSRTANPNSAQCWPARFRKSDGCHAPGGGTFSPAV